MQITNYGQRNMVIRGPARPYGLPQTPRTRSASPKAQSAAADFVQRISDLRQEYGRLRELVDEAGLASVRSRAGMALSASPITGLDPDGSNARLSSSREINPTPTSVSDRAPTVLRWTPTGEAAGLGSSKMTVGGTYTGSTDSSWKIQINGSVNLDGNRGKLKYSVYKDDVFQSSAIITNADYDTGASLSIGEGLEIAFGPGTLRTDEYFSFQTSASVGTDLDPTKAFNGTGGDDPGLAADTPVTDGGFQLNGVEISVAASDSLNDVLDRINASDAKVTASFDAATDTVQLTSTEAGTTAISIAGDTSGLVAALRLDDATTVAGVAADRSRTIDEVGGLAGVSSGTFSINGVDISIDTSVDSLDDVLTRINSSEAGVKATYSDRSGTLKLVSTGSADLTVDGDGTGLLDRMKVAAGTYKGVQRKGISAHKAAAITEAMVSVVTELNDIFAKLSGAAQVSGIGSARNSLQRGLQRLTGQSGRTQVGLRFDYGGDGPLVDFDDAAQRRFRSALSGNAKGVASFLEGKGTKDGLFDVLDDQLKAASSALASELGSGILLSARA